MPYTTASTAQPSIRTLSSRAPQGPFCCAVCAWVYQPWPCQAASTALHVCLSGLIPPPLSCSMHAGSTPHLRHFRHASTCSFAITAEATTNHKALGFPACTGGCMTGGDNTTTQCLLYQCITKHCHLASSIANTLLADARRHGLACLCPMLMDLTVLIMIVQ